MKNEIIKKIEFMEDSIGSIIHRDLWSIEIFNTISRFKYVVNNDLIKDISNILDEDYKYTHEAILSDVNTHGLFQFTLSIDDYKNLSIKEIAHSYHSYLEERILDSYDNLKSIEALPITLDLFILLYCSIIVLDIDEEFKIVQIHHLETIIKSYEYLNERDSFSIGLEKLKEYVKWQ